VELRVVQRDIEDQPTVQFSVTDSGRGLSPEALARLYEAFFSTKSDGLGIGLNLCRSIVESHQGRIHAENLYNAGQIVGCRFSFWIPVGRSRVPARPATASGKWHESDPETKGTVYVVDDDEAVRDSVQWLLEGQDYRVKLLRVLRGVPLARFDAARGRLPDHRHPHGRHERPRTARAAAGPAIQPAAHGLHHRPRRRAAGGRHHEEGRHGFHPEALQGRPAGDAGRAHAGAGAQPASPSISRPPAATRCWPS
jgi:hypothetical protein